MKNLPLLVFALFAGSETAVSSPLSYEFSFRMPPSSQTDISYISDAPTIPGTDLTDLLPVPPGPIPFPHLSGFPDLPRACSFTVGFETTSFTYIAQTDTTFPNLPGQYLGLPALFVTRFCQSSPATVDISIEAVPEPRTSLLMLAGLVVFCRSVSKSRTNLLDHRGGTTA